MKRVRGSLSTTPQKISVYRLLTTCSAVAYIPFLSKKVKKSEIFSNLPLAKISKNSIIGAVPERRGRNEAEQRGTEARETSGKIEGIGDVLSDGPRKFLGSLFYGKQDRLFENQ